MSGKPYPAGIAEIREHLRKMSALAIEARRLCADRKEIDARLIEIDKSERAEWKAAFALVGNMDVTASGNFGHEGRFSYFLRELVAPTEHPVVTCDMAVPPMPPPFPPPLPPGGVRHG